MENYYYLCFALCLAFDTAYPVVGYVRCVRFPQMQALASLFTCGQRVAVQDVNGQKVTLTGLLTAHTALLKSHCRLRQCSLLCLCAPFPRGYTISRGVPGNCTFEIAFSQATMLTLLLVCAFFLHASTKVSCVGFIMRCPFREIATLRSQ